MAEPAEPADTTVDAAHAPNAASPTRRITQWIGFVGKILAGLSPILFMGKSMISCKFWENIKNGKI